MCRLSNWQWGRTGECCTNWHTSILVLLLIVVVVISIGEVCGADVPNLRDSGQVDQFRGEVSAALLEYCALLKLTVAADDQLTDRFGQLLLELSEIKMLSVQLEEFLYQHYVAGTLTDSSLLVELLLSSRH